MLDNEVEQRIRERAFYIWIERGRPEGRDKEHWQQAESELVAGIAKPENELWPAQKQAASADAPEGAPIEAGPAQVAPGVEVVGQIRCAAVRDLDQGGSTWGQWQSQFAAQSWDAYRRY